MVWFNVPRETLLNSADHCKQKITQLTIDKTIVSCYICVNNEKWRNKMIHLNKKLAHEYISDWFNDNSTKTNDWENDVFQKIVEYYFQNEFEWQNWNDNHKNKLLSLIKNDKLYVKKYKEWFEQNALNQIKRDFV